MAGKTKPGDAIQGVTNLTSTKKVLKECADAFRRIKKEREELNKEAGEVRDHCRQQGIDPNWLLTALRMADLEPEAREHADESYAISREAIGLSFRQSLFDDLDNREKSEEVAAKGKAAKASKTKAAEPATPPPADDSDLAGDDGQKTPHGQDYDPDFDDTPGATTH